MSRAFAVAFAPPVWGEIFLAIVFECEDIDNVYEGLTAAGVEILEEPQKMRGSRIPTETNSCCKDER
jgi:hypothetical protein